MTGELTNAKNRESPDLDVETASTQRAATPGTGGREREAARRAPGDHTHVQQHTAGRQRTERMARTKAAETKGRETIGKRRESDVRAGGQMRRIIGGILGKKGKDKMYEERGAGMWQKGKETNGKGNTGRDKGDKGYKEMGGGAHPDQDTGGSNSRYSYPLVMPGLGEVLDNSTLAQRTGTDRSTTHYHGNLPPQSPAPGRRRRDRQRQRHPPREVRQ